MDFIFYLACFSLPFENLFFAPSAGWATITPIILFVYLCVNVNYLDRVIFKYRKILGIVAIGLLITLLNLFLIEDYLNVAIIRTLNAMISLGLGIVSLFAFDIYFIQKKRSLKKIEKILLVSYTIALFIGLIQFLTIYLDINLFREINGLLCKRDYLRANRVQFTFTEPSFIGMHLFGVLLPIYIYGKNNLLKFLIAIFAIVSIVLGSGVRIILDTVVVVTIYLLFKINFKQLRGVVALIAVSSILFGGVIYEYNNNYRVRSIINEGVYIDGSFASRWFRINASLKGYIYDIPHALLGYGIGQEILPLKKGYDEAVLEYNHRSYFREVNFLYDAEKTSEESVSYSFYVRLISEFGFLTFLFLVMFYIRAYYIANIDWKIMMVIIAYLYLQFESYAFYSWWLLIVLWQINKLENCKA